MTGPRCLQPPTGSAAARSAALRAAAPCLSTERLTLRPPVVADFDLWATLLSGPDSEGLGGPIAREEAWAEFCVYAAGWLLHGHGLWSVECDGALIGFVTLGLEWEDEEPELGYLFATDARGRGFATEAARAARDHALTLLGPGAFVSYIDPGNARSIRVAERLGAQRDADAEARLGPDVQVWRHALRHGGGRDATTELSA